MKVKSFSHVQLLANPWTAAYQAPPSMGFQARVLEWGAIAFSRKPLDYIKNTFLFHITIHPILRAGRDLTDYVATVEPA